MSNASAGGVREDEGADPIPASLPGKSPPAQLRAETPGVPREASGAFARHKSQQKPFFFVVLFF